MSYAASVLYRQSSLQVLGVTYGVLTISAPRARNMTSFSKLILAGRVMIHWYPFSAHAIASPIPASQFTSPPLYWDRPVFPPDYQLDSALTVFPGLTRWLDYYTLPRDQLPIFLSFDHHPLIHQLTSSRWWMRYLCDSILHRPARREVFTFSHYPLAVSLTLTLRVYRRT